MVHDIFPECFDALPRVISISDPKYFKLAIIKVQQYCSHKWNYLIFTLSWPIVGILPSGNTLESLRFLAITWNTWSIKYWLCNISNLMYHLLHSTHLRSRLISDTKHDNLSLSRSPSKVLTGRIVLWIHFMNMVMAIWFQYNLKKTI